MFPLANPGARAVFVLERLFGRRGGYLVLLEFIPVVGTEARAQWGSRSRWRGALVRAYQDHVVAPVLRRCLLTAQSLTRWEMARNACHFGLAEDRFRFVPYLASSGPCDVLPPPGAGEGVLASGRAACDWETVFGAALGSSWPLTVVCSRADLDRVSRLNHDGRATVLCEITRDEHAQRMRDAGVYLLALREAEVSSGHVRLGDAAAAGTAVVASAVRGLEDYLEAGATALTFTPGDAAGAALAVSQLCEDTELRGSIAQAARDGSLKWSREQYLEAVAELVQQSAGSADHGR
ncbi:MAG: glycosyltransferase [Solirubrobacteraceae bacterium]